MLSVVSLFAGAGGLDLGLESTRAFRSVACIDSDEDCINTLKTNKLRGLTSHAHDFLRDATIVKRDLTKAAIALRGVTREPVDVVVGGPPCQAFSVLGKRRGTEDSRGGLVFSFMDAVAYLRPRAFVFENVPGFMSIDQGRTFAGVLQRAEVMGYECWWGKLCAADYGDPTIRTRFFLIGVIDPQVPLQAPPATHGLRNDTLSSEQDAQSSVEGGSPQQVLPYQTVSGALAGLENPGPDRPTLNAHVAINHRRSTVERFSRLRPGERDVARRRNRLRLDSPALTLFAGGIKGKKQARTHIHPVFPRELTPRECARLHSFPDYWEFQGAYDIALTQVANSVPLNLGAAMGRLVAAACSREHR